MAGFSLKDLASRLQGFIQQNPTPMGYLGNQVQQRLPQVQQQVQRIAQPVQRFVQQNPTPMGLLQQKMQPIEQYKRTYAQNRYIQPIANIPQNFQTLTNKNLDWKERGMGGLGLAGGVATLFPDPIGDVAIPLFDAYKGFQASAIRGGNLKQNVQSGLQSLSLEKPVGLGTAFSTDPTKETIGNIAELPLMFAIAGKVGKQQIDTKNILKNETNINRALEFIKNYDKIEPAKQADRFMFIETIARKVIPEVLNSKEMKQLAKRNDPQYFKYIKTFLEDRLVQAKHPELNIGLSVKELKKKPSGVGGEIGKIEKQIKTIMSDTRKSTETKMMEVAPLRKQLNDLGGVKPSGIQNSTVPLAEPQIATTKPLKTPKSNKPLLSNASTPIIPSGTTPKPEQVAATLPSRINSFIEKTLGYSTQNPTGGTKGASLWTRTLRKGEEAVTRKVEQGLASENMVVRNAASTLQNFFRGLGMSPERAAASSQLRGAIGTSNERAFDVMESLYKSLKNDKGSLERINAVLDPSISKLKVSFNQLTPTEKQVYSIIREGLDIVHDTSYANGHITKEIYMANKGKYTPRMYETLELPAEVNKFVTQGKKMVNDMYKKKGEITDWKVENALNDPVYALGKRLAQVETNAAIKKYTDFLASNPLYTSAVQRPGFTKLSDSAAYGALRGKWVMNSAAEDLKGFFFSNQAMDNLYDVFRAYDRMGIRQLQKKLLTVFNPTTNVGNIVSDQVFGFVTGVDPLTLNKNLIKLKQNPSEFKKLSDYLMRQGIVGSDITRTDFVNRLGQIDEMAGGAKQSGIKKVAEKVQSFYGGTDDAYKISALKSLLDKGFSLEEATRKVADGFQNYATVGKFYDVFSKTPIVGSAFIKFQGDLIRIIKNGAVNNPLGLIAFLGTLKGISYLSSKLSGETDENRVARENRFAAPMIPGLNIPLTWQTPWGEINVARYISPFYANNDVTGISKMIPFVPNINTKKDVASNIAMNTNDPLLTTPVQLLLNRDFRGKPISDPNENKYAPSTLTPEEKLINQAKFAARGYTPPPINSAIDVVSAAQGKPNMYGQQQTVPQAVARVAGIKIQKYGPEEVAKAKETDEKYQNSLNETIDRQIKSVYKQELLKEITPEQRQKRIENLQKQKKDVLTSNSMSKEEFRYIDKNGSMQTIDLNFQPTEPELTDYPEVNKALISKFKGEITQKKNDLFTLYQEKQITIDEYNTELQKLLNLGGKYAAPKKPKKVTFKKITPKKISITMPKSRKMPALKIKAPPKAKSLKGKNVKAITVKKIAVKKLKGLNNSKRLV